MHRSARRGGRAPAGALLAVWLCLAGETHAQITGMATTDDGSVLYFSTPFNLAGSVDPAPVKIYVYDASGFRLYVDQFPGNAQQAITLSNPWVSGDGSVVAFQGEYQSEYFCGGFFFELCFNTNTVTAVQSGSAAPLIFSGTAVLSASGQYALIPGPILLDLTTGAQTGIPQPPPYNNVLLDGVASDGTVLLYNLGLSLLDTWRPGSIQYIAAATPAAVMNDAATTVVYVQGFALYIYDIASSTGRLFANGSAPSISRNGQWVAFLSPVNGVPQAWAVPADQSQYLQLTNDPFGVTSVIVSGSGNVVYAATAANAIWEYDLTAGTSTQILPPTPAPAYGPGFSGVAGSLVTMSVVGLVQETVTAAAPLPLTLAGYQVLLNGSPAPMFSVSPAAVVFQIPWEEPVDAVATVQLVSPGASPIFEAAPGSIFVWSYSASFLNIPCASIEALCVTATHADGTAVTTSSPAQPGEVLNFPMTGLGAVSPPVATGAAAPASPPVVVEHQFACQLLDLSNVILGNVQILAAVIPPGAVGTYSVTAKLPDNSGSFPYAVVYCLGVATVGDYLPVAARIQ